MPLDALEFATRFFHSQDRRKAGPDPLLCTADYRVTIADGPTMDHAGHDAFGHAFYGGFPDMSHTIETAVGTDETVAVRFRLRATHQGPFLGVAATGKNISVVAHAFLALRGGQVSEVRGVFDEAGLLRQIGAIRS
ncbi:MAG: ester cyclase [Vicinamibacterales bacterium]